MTKDKDIDMVDLLGKAAESMDDPDTATTSVGLTGTGAVFAPVSMTSLSANRSTGVAPLDVTFGVTPSGGSGTYTYSWDFESDGAADSTAQNPAHTYSAAGSYTATVTVTDAGDAGNSTTGQLTVNALEATAATIAALNTTSSTRRIKSRDTVARPLWKR